MANQAGVGTILLSESRRQVTARDVVDLMRGGRKHQAVHDRRHVAGDTTAARRAHGMMGMPSNAYPDRRMALGTHLVRIRDEFQRYAIRFRIGGMRIVATGALGGAAPEACGPQKGLSDERGLTETAVLLEHPVSQLPLKLDLHPQ